MKARTTLHAIVMAALTLGGCAVQEPQIPVGGQVAITRNTFAFDQERIKEPFNLFPEYRLVPGDILDVLFQIQTWAEKDTFPIAVDHTLDIRFVHTPDLNQNQRVRPDGTISLPYIGRIHVVGKSIDQLTTELRQLYSKELREPELYVVVPDFRSAIKELKADLHTAPRGLSRLVTIRPDGYVTFPMVGEILVANRSVKDVSEELNKKYEAILPGLHCDLFLEQHAGSVVYVLGEVSRPGLFKVNRPTSVLEAIAQAGNFTAAARLDSVIVIRKKEDKLIATRLSLAENLSLGEGTAFFYLFPDDIVYVPKTKIAQIAELSRQIGDIIFFRGWSVGLSWELHNAPESNTQIW